VKKIIVLGATGSIGKSALDIIRSRPDAFQAAALSCHSQKEELHRLAREFGSLAYVAQEDGGEGLVRMIRETQADCVVNGISGAAGFLPSVAAIESGKTLALANKETLVMAGNLVMGLARRHGTAIIPVDSEHSAVFRMLRAFGEEAVESLILTASGGPFRDVPKEKLSAVSVQDALKHPTWNMGRKITIDSASLANKGLEVIEAHYLFRLPPERIQVLVHPQSYVHSLVETRDGMQYAQIGRPDMRVPILSALAWPEEYPWTPGKFSLAGMSLGFSLPDTEKFPMLALAYACLKQGGSWPLVYNAANEIAVQAFVGGAVPFTGISDIVAQTLETGDWPAYNSVEEVLQLDARARKEAKRFCQWH
jgi:1-deoxy-D-xylulose-5-phosphate reductoisomerase